MPDIIVARSFRQELAGAHALAMQCGGLALRFLERAKKPSQGPACLRANIEALRMAGLASRLMEGVGRGVRQGGSPSASPGLRPAGVRRNA